MKIKKYWFLLCLVLCLAVLACGCENRPILTGTYRLVKHGKSPAPVRPSVILSKNNKFYIHASVFSSYMPVGSYKMDDDRLTMTTYEGRYTYVFLLDGDKLIFQAGESSEITVYANERPIVDGDVFVKEN